MRRRAGGVRGRIEPDDLYSLTSRAGSNVLNCGEFFARLGGKSYRVCHGVKTYQAVEF